MNSTKPTAGKHARDKQRNEGEKTRGRERFSREEVADAKGRKKNGGVRPLCPTTTEWLNKPQPP